MRKRIKVTGFSDWDTMFYNNLLSIPVLSVFSIIAEDWGTENLQRNLCVSNYTRVYFWADDRGWSNVCPVNSPEATRNFLLFAIAFSGAAAVGISYTTAWCIRATSSTTYRSVPITSGPDANH